MISTDRMIRSLSTLVFAVGIAACGGDGPTNENGNGNGNGPPVPPSVAVRDNSFNPSSLTVSSGTTVTWNWSGVNLHTVTFDDGIGNSGPEKSSGTHTRQFTQTGTFVYICDVHGRATMSGVVVVE